jgi:hypothetical protein
VTHGLPHRTKYVTFSVQAIELTAGGHYLFHPGLHMALRAMALKASPSIRTPNRHIPGSVSHNVRAAVYEASDLVSFQRISIAR